MSAIMRSLDEQRSDKIRLFQLAIGPNITFHSINAIA